MSLSHQQIAAAILHLDPDAEFDLVGTDISGLPWTGSQIEAAWADIAAAVDEAAALAALRAERNARLAACDWTQMSDVPLSTEQRDAWAEYRQTLRDLPETVDPVAPEWPAIPA